MKNLTRTKILILAKKMSVTLDGIVTRAGEEAEAKPGLGKLGLPHKRTGRYPGHLWAPPGPTALFFLAQLVTLPYVAEGAWLGAGVGLFVMATSFLWILCYSVHFYVDFERGWITREGR